MFRSQLLLLLLLLALLLLCGTSLALERPVVGAALACLPAERVRSFRIGI